MSCQHNVSREGSIRRQKAKEIKLFILSLSRLLRGSITAHQGSFQISSSRLMIHCLEWDTLAAEGKKSLSRGQYYGKKENGDYVILPL